MKEIRIIITIWKIDRRWIWGIAGVNFKIIRYGESYGFVTACRQARAAYLKELRREGKYVTVILPGPG
jgi:hypothetical protein